MDGITTDNYPVNKNGCFGLPNGCRYQTCLSISNIVAWLLSRWIKQYFKKTIPNALNNQLHPVKMKTKNRRFQLLMHSMNQRFLRLTYTVMYISVRVFSQSYTRAFYYLHESTSRDLFQRVGQQLEKLVNEFCLLFQCCSNLLQSLARALNPRVLRITEGSSVTPSLSK